MKKWSRLVHKWLMVIVGTQFIIWSVSGAYMVLLDIDYIHGDSLVNNPQITLDADTIGYSQAQLLTEYPQAQQVTLSTLVGKPVYRFVTGEQRVMVSALDGTLLSPVDESLAKQLARERFAINEPIKQITFIADNPPFELNPRALPVWRVDFDHWAAPTLYIQAQTGELVGKRHAFWRLFDWMFRFHVMDYSSGEDIGNQLLFWVSLLSLVGALTGMLLVYLRVIKPQWRALKQRRLARSPS